VIELKMRLGVDNNTKDVAQSWKIIILVRDDCIMVRQRKRERDIQEQFEFQWELTVKLERKMAFCQGTLLLFVCLFVCLFVSLLFCVVLCDHCGGGDACRSVTPNVSSAGSYLSPLPPYIHSSRAECVLLRVGVF
jgi:hypothetical protein